MSRECKVLYLPIEEELCIPRGIRGAKLFRSLAYRLQHKVRVVEHIRTHKGMYGPPLILNVVFE
jgi:hypothetical protein